MESVFLTSSYSTYDNHTAPYDNDSDHQSKYQTSFTREDGRRGGNHTEEHKHENKNDGYKVMSAVINTPCCDSREKVYVKIRDPPQVYLLGYFNGPYPLTANPSVIPFNRASSTFPHNYCNGIFTIPRCTDGLYQIIVTLSSEVATGEFSVLVTDETQLRPSSIASVSINNDRQVITIVERLKSGYSIRVVGSGTGTLLADSDSFLNIVRVA